jgi:hypothetical protein
MSRREWPLGQAVRIVGQWERPSHYKALSHDAKVRLDWLLSHRRPAWLLSQARDLCTDDRHLRQEYEDALDDLIAG